MPAYATGLRRQYFEIRVFAQRRRWRQIMNTWSRPRHQYFEDYFSVVSFQMFYYRNGPVNAVSAVFGAPI
jgi:hypothetical protein